MSAAQVLLYRSATCQAFCGPRTLSSGFPGCFLMRCVVLLSKARWCFYRAGRSMLKTFVTSAQTTICESENVWGITKAHPRSKEVLQLALGSRGLRCLQESVLTDWMHIMERLHVRVVGSCQMIVTTSSGTSWPLRQYLDPIRKCSGGILRKAHGQ